MVLFSVNDSLSNLLLSLGRVTASYDKLTGVLATTSLQTQSLLTPRRTGRLTHTVTTTVTTTMWVVYGVHNNTTDTRAFTQVTVTTGFTDLDVLVLFVTDGTEARSTLQVN